MWLLPACRIAPGSPSYAQHEQHALLTLSCAQEWEKRVSAGRSTSTEVAGHSSNDLGARRMSNDLGARQEFGGAEFSTRNRWNALT